MKRIIAIVLVVVMVAALFAGCSGSGSKVEGTYKIKTINDMSPKEFYLSMFEVLGFTADDLAELGFSDEVLDNMLTITLKEGGEVVYASNMDEEGETGTGTWKQEGNKIIITIDDESQEFEFKDGNLVITEGEGDEAMTMVLSK